MGCIALLCIIAALLNATGLFPSVMLYSRVDLKTVVKSRLCIICCSIFYLVGRVVTTSCTAGVKAAQQCNNQNLWQYCNISQSFYILFISCVEMVSSSSKLLCPSPLCSDLDLSSLV